MDVPIDPLAKIAQQRGSSPSEPYANIRSMKEIGPQVIELHSQGLRTIEIAHRLGVAQSTVHHHLRRAQDIAQSGPQVEMPKRNDDKPSSKTPTRELVRALLGRGMTRVEVARRLGIAKSTVSYHARRLGQPMDERFAKRIDWTLVQSYYDEGHSVRDCARMFDFSTWAWHGAVRSGHITPRPGFRPIEEIFAANTRRSRGHLKSRLVHSGLKDERCERCGISEWLGRPVSVALHHINGDRLDNRLENLEFLCPNCHSQTDNFGGRGGRPGVRGSEREHR
jgi:DNA-binding CsgD family transcriptional regulator